jgi:hypothetical protein
MDWMATLIGADTLHSFLGRHDRAHNELDAQQEGHEHREAAHGGRGHSAWPPKLPTNVNTSTLAIMIRPFLISRFW